MREKLLNGWLTLRSNLWFFPLLMAMAGIGLSLLTTWADRQIDESEIAQYPWLYTGSADGARLMLSTIAGSMMNTLALTLSITVVALTLASSQYGHRLLRNFIQDAANQVVIGSFVLIFLYCLVTLRTVQGGNGVSFVPQISVTTAVVLAIAGLGMLIYFINHVVQSIEIENLVDRINTDLQSTIRRMYPPREEWHETPAEVRSKILVYEDRFNQESDSIPAPGEGYIQTLDYDQLVKIACRHGLIIRINAKPGDFICARNTMANLLNDTGGPVYSDKPLIRDIQETVVIGRRRNMVQDVAFGIDELVEIALRALSPGINAPFTAIECINRLASSLSLLAQRAPSHKYVRDEHGDMRLLTRQLSFPSMIDAAFNPIRRFSSNMPIVQKALLDALILIAEQNKSEEIRLALQRHAQLTEACTREMDTNEQEQQEVDERYWRLINILHGVSPPEDGFSPEDQHHAKAPGVR